MSGADQNLAELRRLAEGGAGALTQHLLQEVLHRMSIEAESAASALRSDPPTRRTVWRHPVYSD